MTDTPVYGRAHLQSNSQNPAPVNEALDTIENAANSLKTWTITGDIAASQAAMAEGFVHRLGGAPAAAFAFNLPAGLPRVFHLVNVSGKTATVQVTGGAGLGVVIPTGQARTLRSDGTDVVPLDGRLEVIRLAVGDETTALTTGTALHSFRMPFPMTLTAVRASVATDSSSGVVTVDINEAGTSVLSTKLTIDASEKTSQTAASPAVISDASLADDAEVTIDIDAAGTGAAGLKVTLIGVR